MKEISGTVERITFANAESGFTVLRLQEEGKEKLTCAVGKMPPLTPGESVRLSGEWKNDRNHGWQFAVEETLVEAPATVLGIKKYLGSGLVEGIGPVYAEKIVEAFGEQTLEVIDGQPHRLLEVEGIGHGRLAKIKACWSEQRVVREVMVFLQGHGVTPAYAQKIFKVYGAEAIARVKANPYDLSRDVFGIGFKIADQIAGQMGIERDSPQRVEAGLEYVLEELSSEGHTCYPRDEFVDRAMSILEVGSGLVEEQIDQLLEKRRIVQEEGKVWLKTLYMHEEGIAREVGRLTRQRCALREIDTAKALEWVQERLKLKLAPEQGEAVAQALSEKFQIITGGPGTGKSTITKAILAVAEKLTGRITLAAPTGRAAKRMAEITRRHASTIHSLLEWDFKGGGFKRGRDNPLPTDLLIVDEASMIDTALMFSLLRAVPGHARVILVGDIDQLPSVGPGNVLRDMIASERLPVTTLTKIFRQAAGSKITTNAHKIRQGVFPDLSQEGDFFFCEAEDPQVAQGLIVDLVHRRLPAAFSFNPVKEIQVLAPMKRGLVGTEQLNEVLQQRLNPNANPLIRANRRFHRHDKVMQIRNNYNKEVYNGDVGTISAIDADEQTLIVDYEGRCVPYPFNDLDELVPAYAISVHKFQGSECPCIVMPVHTTHFKLLQRNLLYTGVTRGKKLVVLVGTKKAISIALSNNDADSRHTGLQGQLERHLCPTNTTTWECPLQSDTPMSATTPS